jgi:pimeloyl-ACP methyl ester carboxylesterase
LASSFFRQLLAPLLLITSGVTAHQPATVSEVPVNPISVSGLRQLAQAKPVEFKLEYMREDLQGIQQRVVSFNVDDLREFALVLQPQGPAPKNGWPTLLINHGHHPNPPQYGRVESGETDRPGDYYRALPLAFAKQGFLVLVPDFRGHNDSEGAEFAHGPLESNWYSRDSIVAFRALDSLPEASRQNRFMWGHSMGGAVTLRAILALGNRVKAASIWSSTTTDSLKAALYYSLNQAGIEDSLTTSKPALETLQTQITALPFEYISNQGDASRFIKELNTPLNIHHSILDLKSTPYHWSVELAGELLTANKPYNFYSYAGDRHLFEGETLSIAIQRDVTFFRNLLMKNDNANKP